MAISRAQIVKELVPALDKLFGAEYAKYAKPEYKMRFCYGKYSVYKYELGQKVQRVAKGLTKEEATGIMKLLESDDE